MIAQSVSDVSALRQEKLQAIRISVSASALDRARINEFRKVLSSHLQQGRVLIELAYQRANGVQGILRLGDEWRVKACDDLFDRIAEQFGEASIHYIYDAGEIRNGLTYKAPPPRFQYNRRGSSKPQASV